MAVENLTHQEFAEIGSWSGWFNLYLAGQMVRTVEHGETDKRRTFLCAVRANTQCEIQSDQRIPACLLFAGLNFIWHSTHSSIEANKHVGGFYLASFRCAAASRRLSSSTGAAFPVRYSASMVRTRR